MKAKTILVAVLSLGIIVAGYGLVQAHGGRGWNNYDRGYGHMGYNGGYMMDYRGGYGQGMMGYGGDYQGNMMNYQDYQPCWNDSGSRVRADITEDTAKEIVENSFTRNPNLKIGKVEQTEDGFKVQVVTKKGEALVDRLLVEKETGRVYRVYE